MVEFFIVKNKDEEAFYKADNDICYASLGEAYEDGIRWLCSEYDTKSSDYYILKCKATDNCEITKCFYSAANGQKSSITKYEVLEIITFRENV